MVQSPIKNYKNLLFQWSLILIILSSLISNIHSQQVTQTNETEFEMFNKTLTNFNQSLLLFDDIAQKMVNITMNIVLRVRFKALKRNKNNLQQAISKIEEELNKDKYNSQKIIVDIKSLNKDIKNFDGKYKKLNELYLEFESLKEFFSNFFKVFFIILLIVVLIVISLIGIVSFFVIKKQKKYYKLQEEISVNDLKDVSKKVDLNMKYNIAKKIVKKEDLTTEEPTEINIDQKVHIKNSSNAPSNEELNKEEIK